VTFLGEEKGSKEKWIWENENFPNPLFI